jgi:hypothetical protein
MRNPLCALRSIVNLCLLLWIVASCSEGEQKPEALLPADKMAVVLTDVHLIEGAKTGRKIMGDTLFIETYYAKVFHKHNTNLEDFNLSFEYYAAHPKMMNLIYEQVIENLNKMEIRVPAWEKQEDSLAVHQDTTINAEEVQEMRKKINKLMPFQQDTTEAN